MLRRAIQRARRHLPASTGPDNGGSAYSSDEEDGQWSPDVAYTTLRDDDAARDHFRKQPEDISGVHLLVDALQAAQALDTPRRKRVEFVNDEERGAADAWARLQRLYGLFRELEAASASSSGDESEDFEAPEGTERKERRRSAPRRRDQGLRTLLQEARVPPGVILRNLQALSTTDGSKHNGMPQGFTAGMFASLGNALYSEMLVAAEQNRISPDALEELGDCLYAEAATLAVSAAA
ncbi:hypothetical protein BBJ28_00006103 [Nothophytophthora sp. Chile5]|nr:hypothetical protein BBJ28_00006103 [Nothophytophthora sp. Chile5]